MTVDGNGLVMEGKELCVSRLQKICVLLPRNLNIYVKKSREKFFEFITCTWLPNTVP